MFDKKELEKVELTELRAIKMISEVGLKTEHYNKKSKNDIDLIVENKLIDVQYSGNFEKYGDIRIDLLSSFKWKSEIKNIFRSKYKGLNDFGQRKWFIEIQKSLRIEIQKLNNEFIKTKNKKLNVLSILNNYMSKTEIKLGKYFQNNELEGVLYFIYENKIEKDFIDFKNQKISKIVFISPEAIKKSIQLGSKEFDNLWSFKRFKVNDKKTNKLKDDFESAFIAFNLKTLLRDYPEKVKVYNNKEEFYNNFKKDFNDITKKNKITKRSKKRQKIN